MILIHADTLRPDHLDLYGHSRKTAPFLSRLAARRGHLPRARTRRLDGRRCRRRSFLTSLYPTTHGVAKLADRLPASATTIAEVYRAAGYATLVDFVGAVHRSAHQPSPGLRGAARGRPRSLDAAPPYTSKTAREYVDRSGRLDRSASRRTVLPLPARVRSAFSVRAARALRRAVGGSAPSATRTSPSATRCGRPWPIRRMRGGGWPPGRRWSRPGIDPAVISPTTRTGTTRRFERSTPSWPASFERLRSAGVDRDTADRVPERSRRGVSGPRADVARAERLRRDGARAARRALAGQGAGWNAGSTSPCSSST